MTVRIATQTLAQNATIQLTGYGWYAPSALPRIAVCQTFRCVHMVSSHVLPSQIGIMSAQLHDKTANAR